MLQNAEDNVSCLAKMHLKRFYFLLLLMLLTWPVFAQVDSIRIAGMMRTKNIPGLGVAFIDNGHVVEEKVFGELRNGVPAPADAVFNVASITKTITTMVTLQLVGSGQWDLDAPVARYWTDPEVKDDPRSKRLTTRHILTHRSGFPNWRRMVPDKKLAFQFEPGDHFQYSGEGMEYLRRALEGKFHRSLQQLADSLIFRPLGMTSSSLVWNEAFANRFAVPHNDRGEALAINKNSVPSAADLFKTTTGDYCKFLIWVMNGAGLSDSLYHQMTSPLAKIKADKYMGLGWANYPDLPGGQYGLSHSGVDPGVQTLTVLLPKMKRALIIFTNSDNGWMLYNELAKDYLGGQGAAIGDIEMKN